MRPALFSPIYLLLHKQFMSRTAASIPPAARPGAVLAFLLSHYPPGRIARQRSLAIDRHEPGPEVPHEAVPDLSAAFSRQLLRLSRDPRRAGPRTNSVPDSDIP